MAEVYSLDPLVIRRPYSINYIHSFGEVSRYFEGLQQKKLYATRCPQCNATWLPPRRDCARCGERNIEWFEAPLEGRVHSFSILSYAAEAFWNDLPFVLAYIEFDGIDTVLLTRLANVKPEDVSIGMPVRAKFKRLVEWSPSDVSFVPA